ncbi:hypothetical protein [Aliarcobacter butzleri]|uniref:hypothetical protein n=1 Tax=Aliarcobacter butzleri TaxID=28197 RepID=UPI00263E03C0|nr:hypothetical protein [Aliarcobacter butzleri]MDN5055551.1 hypothetical protein [Aliarcobacter butzleri]
MAISKKFTFEMLMNSSFSQKDVKFINIKDTSPMGVTLEYFMVINKILDYYVDNPIYRIKDEVQNINLIEYSFSKRFMEPNYFENFEEKSFLGKALSVITSLSYEVKILKIDSAIDLLKKHFHLEDSYKKMIDDFLKNNPEYKQAKDELDRLENEKVKKINQINSFITALDKFRQYILKEFNPIILKFLDLIKEDEKNIRTQYIEIVEKLNQQIEYSFKSTSSKVIIKPKMLLKWNELKDNIKIIEEDNNALDNQINKIIRNQFFINYKDENLEYFNSMKIQINSLTNKKMIQKII